MSRNFYISIGFAVAGILLFASPLYRANAATTPAPDWQLKDLDGQTVKLSDFKGKVVILNFWATWCGPCRVEIPAFKELQGQYAAQGLTVIGVVIDTEAPDVKSFVMQVGINYPVVLADEKTVADYGGFTVIPVTFIIDRKGNIVASHQGAKSKRVFESEILPLLEQK